MFTHTKFLLFEKIECDVYLRYLLQGKYLTGMCVLVFLKKFCYTLKELREKGDNYD